MQVADNHHSQFLWVPVNDQDEANSDGELLRIGQLVSSEAIAGTEAFGTGGVRNYGIAAGIGGIGDDVVPAGIVVGHNKTRKLSALDKFVGIDEIESFATAAEQIATTTTQHGGNTAQGEHRAMVQIALITPYTKLKVPIYNATRGTAITVNTVTTGSSTGVGCTTDSADITTVAELCTAYCRKGLNKGLMRQISSAHATIHTFGMAFPHAIAVDDQFVIVPLREFGISYPNLDAEADFFNNADGLATDYMFFYVHELHLEKAGEEYVTGTISPFHWHPVRSVT